MHKTQEVTGFLSSLNNVEAKIKVLLDQAKAAKRVQDQAEEGAETAEAITEVLKSEIKDAEAKIVEVKKKLQEALATKEVEIKATDKKAFSEE